MYTFLVFLACFITIEARLGREELIVISKECNASPDDLKTILQYEVPHSSTGKCLMRCFAEKFDLLSPSGVYDQRRGFLSFKKLWNFPTKDLSEINNRCGTHAFRSKHIPGTCDYGYEIMKCITSEFWNKGFIKSG